MDCKQKSTPPRKSRDLRGGFSKPRCAEQRMPHSMAFLQREARGQDLRLRHMSLLPLTPKLRQPLPAGSAGLPQLVQKPRRVSPPQRRKKVSIIFFGDMCGEENTARPANVRAVRQGGRRVRCSRPQTLSSKKYYFFDKENPAGDCLRGCLRVAAVYCIRGGPCPLGLPCGSGT